MTDPREVEPDPPDYAIDEQDDDWEVLLEWAPPVTEDTDDIPA